MKKLKKNNEINIEEDENDLDGKDEKMKMMKRVSMFLLQQWKKS